MKFLIGQVPAQDIEMFGEDGLYEYDGDFYYNQVEIGTNAGGIEDFVISDGIGRSVPVSTDHLGSLIATLQNIQNYIETVNEGKAAHQAIFEDEVHVTYGW